MKKVTVFLQDRWLVWLILGVFAISLGLVIWNGGHNGVFDAPDSTVNYYFARQVAEGGGLSLPTPNLPYNEYLVPRSARVVGQQIVPTGFSGLPWIYGLLSRLTSVALLPYWTVIFAVIALWCWYALWRTIWNKQAALLILLLTAFHPAWWYYSFRGLMPNILFCSLVLISVFNWFRAHETQSLERQIVRVVIATFFLLLALAVRTSEIVWIAPLAVIALVMSRQKKNLWLTAVTSFIIIFIVGLFINKILSGSFWQLSYNIATLPGQSLLLPFGFHPRTILTNLWNFGFLLFWPFTVMSLAGLLVATQKNSAWFKQYFICVLLMGGIVVLYYGSWVVNDNPQPQAVTIGTSFVRYFLPLFIVMIPMVVLALLQAAQRFSAQRGTIAALLALTIILISGGPALNEPGEGIFPLRRELALYDRVATAVAQSTEASAVILTPKGDKYLWPKRLVLTPSGDDGYLSAVSPLLQSGTAVYYLHLPLTPEGKEELNNQWGDYHFQLGDTKWTIDSLALYTLVPTP